MVNIFANTLKHKSNLGQIKYSDAYGQYLFKGVTKGLALKYVASGNETYYIDNEIIIVKEGHFILVHPDTDFEACTKKQAKNTQGLCIDLSLTVTKTDLKKILCNKLLFGQTFNLSKSTAIGQQLNLISASIPEKVLDVGKDEVLLNIANQLYSFSENIFQYKKEIYSVAKKEVTQHYIIQKILQSREYIMENYKERITLDQLAEHSAISKFQLLKLFKKCFNCSPKEMQSALRMREALILLQTKQDSISKIAFDLGYFDIAAFSKKFKAHFGVNPSVLK